MTSVYLVGNTFSSNFIPDLTVTATIECWGAGQAGDDTTGNGGVGGGYAKKNSFALTAGTPINFCLGAPGLTSAQPGGNTFFQSALTIVAVGGAAGTTQVGDVTFLGGTGGAFASQAIPGGGGSGGPLGAGQNGGNSLGAGGGGGGGCGGGQPGGAGPGPSGAGPGGAGGNGPQGQLGGKAGLITGTIGTPGNAGAGGGGGGGDNTTIAGNGSNGGDNFDFGGGGGSGSGFGGASLLTNGGNGGTPGGGGTDQFNGGILGHGGWSVIKITYPGGGPNQIQIFGTFVASTTTAAGPQMDAEAHKAFII